MRSRRVLSSLVSLVQLMSNFQKCSLQKSDTEAEGTILRKAPRFHSLVRLRSSRAASRTRAEIKLLRDVSALSFERQLTVKTARCRSTKAKAKAKQGIREGRTRRERVGGGGGRRRTCPIATASASSLAKDLFVRFEPASAGRVRAIPR